MAQAILEVIKTMIEGTASAFANVVNSLIPIFWTAGVGEAAGSLTFIGVIVLITLSISLLTFVVNWVTRLVKARGR